MPLIQRWQGFGFQYNFSIYLIKLAKKLFFYLIPCVCPGWSMNTITVAWQWQLSVTHPLCRRDEHCRLPTFHSQLFLFSIRIYWHQKKKKLAPLQNSVGKEQKTNGTKILDLPVCHYKSSLLSVRRTGPMFLWWKDPISLFCRLVYARCSCHPAE